MSDLTLSWKPEIQIKSNGQWHALRLRFATEAEAQAYADRFHRLFGVEMRATPSSDPVNEKFADGRSVPVAPIHV